MMDKVKYLGLVVAFAVVAGSGGCFSITAQSDAHANRKLLFTDTIFAVGRPDTALTQQLGVPVAVAFLGMKNTYMLLEGGEALIQIATELDGNRISLPNHPRELYVTHRQELFIREKTVWGSLTVAYGSNKTYRPDELATLNKLGFVLGQSAYEKTIPVKGVIYPPITLSAEQAQKLKIRRPVVFYDAADSEPLHVSTNKAKSTLALTADIVTMPIQFMGFVVWAMTLKGKI